jgi:hypothetical protein
MLRTLSERTTVKDQHAMIVKVMNHITFIFADVLEGECKTGVFALDNSNLSKSALADHPQ